ncbi:hypothetical protein [Ensifer adhaerens]|uniref:hypothetical protein n=1 Tax=Ensifer adhaerens TaxID=106592 RepID=UPI00098FA9FE|nr:hypothetical protein [Ensifer adhaerens]
MIENPENRRAQQQQPISPSQEGGPYGGRESEVGEPRVDQNVASDDRSGQAKAAAAKVVDDEKGALARQLRGLAGAMEKVGSELRKSDQPGLGRYTQNLGNSIGRLASECEDRDLGEIASIAENYGRKQPLAFLGIAAIAGLAASRFLTASAKRTTGKTSNSSSSPRVGDDWAFEKDFRDA